MFEAERSAVWQRASEAREQARETVEKVRAARARRLGAQDGGGAESGEPDVRELGAGESLAPGP